MIDPIIPYERLQHLFGGASPNDVILRLEQARVRWLPGKRGRPFTTLVALNDAMGLSSHTPESKDTIEVL